MCTSIIEIAPAEGMAKRGDQWFELTTAVVAYDHARHANLGVTSGRQSLVPLVFVVVAPSHPYQRDDFVDLVCYVSCGLVTVDRDLRVGRGEQNDVVLPDSDKAVSRFHAELRYENGVYILVDANSPNGIWVNGLREAEIAKAPRST